MSLIDHAIKANEQFAKKYDPKLGGHPQPKIAVVTCMDPRLSDLEGILGLKTADIDVIRTGGPAVTDDVLGELVVSTRVLGSKEIMLLNHTGCGFTTFTDKELNDKLARETGDATPVPMRLFSFKDPEENTRADREGPVASMDCQGCARSGLHFRRGHRSVARSQAWMTAGRRRMRFRALRCLRVLRSCAAERA
jgi:carbonic anhydrase